MLVVNGIPIVGPGVSASNSGSAVTSIVPPNATYELTSANNGNAGVGMLYTWVEIS
jgi:hypothetical protein